MRIRRRRGEEEAGAKEMERVCRRGRDNRTPGSGGRSVADHISGLAPLAQSQDSTSENNWVPLPGHLL